MDVRLVSRQDGEYVELGREVSMLSLLIATVIEEDAEETGKEENKSVVAEGFNVDVPTPILRLVVEFMNKDYLSKSPSGGSEQTHNDFIIEKPLQQEVLSITALVPDWCATFIDVEDDVLRALIRAADYMIIKHLLDLALTALACRIRGGVAFSLRAIPYHVGIDLITSYLNIEDVFEMDSRVTQGDVVEWRNLLRSQDVSFEGSWTNALSLEVIRWIAESHVAIKKLRFPHNITDEGLTSISMSQGCQQLRSINMRECTEVSDLGLIALFRQCSNLDMIDLFCCRISCSGVVALSESCPALTYLSLNGCQAVDDASVIAVSMQCPALSTIGLNGCTITDVAMVALSERCPALTTIHVRLCTDITDEGVIALSRGCPALTSVNLSFCSNITDAGLTALAIGSPNIVKLDLSHCVAITDAGLVAVSQRCPALSTIELIGCDECSDEGLMALRDGCPGLENIELSESPNVVLDEMWLWMT